MLVSAVSFGTMALIARQAFRAGLDVPTLMFLRFSVSGLVMAAATYFKREALPGPRTLSELVLMGGLLYFGQSFAFFSALRFIPAPMVSLLLYVYPAIVAVGASVLFKERLTGAKVAALVLALTGCALTIGPVGPGNLAGITIALGSAVLYSAYILLGANATQSVRPLPCAAIVMSSTAFSYGVVLLVHRPSPLHSAGLGWGLLLGMVSIAAVGGLLAGMPLTGPVNASVLSALEPIVTTILAALFMGQALGWLQAMGGVLIIGAVVWLALTSKDRAQVRPGGQAHNLT